MKKFLIICGLLLSSLFFVSCTADQAFTYAVTTGILIADRLGDGSGGGATGGAGSYQNIDENYQLGTFNMRSGEFTEGEHVYKLYLPETDYYRATNFTINTAYDSFSGYSVRATIEGFLAVKGDYNLKVDVYGNVYDTDKLIADTFHYSCNIDPYSSSSGVRAEYVQYYKKVKWVVPKQEILIVVSHRGQIVGTNNPYLLKKILKIKENTTSTVKASSGTTNKKTKTTKSVVKTPNKETVKTNSTSSTTSASVTVKAPAQNSAPRKKQTRQ